MEPIDSYTANRLTGRSVPSDCQQNGTNPHHKESMKQAACDSGVFHSEELVHTSILPYSGAERPGSHLTGPGGSPVETKLHTGVPGHYGDTVQSRNPDPGAVSQASRRSVPEQIPSMHDRGEKPSPEETRLRESIQTTNVDGSRTSNPDSKPSSNLPICDGNGSALKGHETSEKWTKGGVPQKRLQNEFDPIKGIWRTLGVKMHSHCIRQAGNLRRQEAQYYAELAKFRNPNSQQNATNEQNAISGAKGAQEGQNSAPQGGGGGGGGGAHSSKSRGQAVPTQNAPNNRPPLPRTLSRARYGITAVGGAAADIVFIGMRLYAMRYERKELRREARASDRSSGSRPHVAPSGTLHRERSPCSSRFGTESRSSSPPSPPCVTSLKLAELLKNNPREDLPETRPEAIADMQRAAFVTKEVSLADCPPSDICDVVSSNESFYSPDEFDGEEKLSCDAALASAPLLPLSMEVKASNLADILRRTEPLNPGGATKSLLTRNGVQQPVLHAQRAIAPPPSARRGPMDRAQPSIGQFLNRALPIQHAECPVKPGATSGDCPVAAEAEAEVLLAASNFKVEEPATPVRRNFGDLVRAIAAFPIPDEPPAAREIQANQRNEANKENVCTSVQGGCVGIKTDAADKQRTYSEGNTQASALPRPVSQLPSSPLAKTSVHIPISIQIPPPAHSGMEPSTQVRVHESQSVDVISQQAAVICQQATIISQQAAVISQPTRVQPSLGPAPQRYPTRPFNDRISLHIGSAEPAGVAGECEALPHVLRPGEHQRALPPGVHPYALPPGVQPPLPIGPPPAIPALMPGNPANPLGAGTAPAQMSSGGYATVAATATSAATVPAPAPAQAVPSSNGGRGEAYETMRSRVLGKFHRSASYQAAAAAKQEGQGASQRGQNFYQSTRLVEIHRQVDAAMKHEDPDVHVMPAIPQSLLAASASSSFMPASLDEAILVHSGRATITEDGTVVEEVTMQLETGAAATAADPTRTEPASAEPAGTSKADSQQPMKPIEQPISSRLRSERSTRPTRASARAVEVPPARKTLESTKAPCADRRSRRTGNTSSKPVVVQSIPGQAKRGSKTKPSDQSRPAELLSQDKAPAILSTPISQVDELPRQQDVAKDLPHPQSENHSSPIEPSDSAVTMIRGEPLSQGCEGPAATEATSMVLGMSLSQGSELALVDTTCKAERTVPFTHGLPLSQASSASLATMRLQEDVRVTAEVSASPHTADRGGMNLLGVLPPSQNYASTVVGQALSQEGPRLSQGSLPVVQGQSLSQGSLLIVQGQSLSQGSLSVMSGQSLSQAVESLSQAVESTPNEDVLMLGSTQGDACMLCSPTPEDVPMPGSSQGDTHMLSPTPADVPMPGSTPSDVPMPGSTPSDVPMPGSTPSDVPMPDSTPSDVQMLGLTQQSNGDVRMSQSSSQSDIQMTQGLRPYLPGAHSAGDSTAGNEDTKVVYEPQPLLSNINARPIPSLSAEDVAMTADLREPQEDADLSFGTQMSCVPLAQDDPMVEEPDSDDSRSCDPLEMQLVLYDSSSSKAEASSAADEQLDLEPTPVVNPLPKETNVDEPPREEVYKPRRPRVVEPCSAKDPIVKLDSRKIEERGSCRILMVNEGKLRPAQLTTIVQFAEQPEWNPDVVVISEGCYTERSVDPSLTRRFEFYGPTAQKKAGCSMLVNRRSSPMLSANLPIVYDPDNPAIPSTCVMPLGSGVAIIGVYALPEVRRAQFQDLLNSLDHVITQYPAVVVCGDFNTGMECKVKALEKWARGHGLDHQDIGAFSHVNETGVKSLLDHVFTRACTFNLLKVKDKPLGHSRVLFEVSLAIPVKNTDAHTDWRRLDKDERTQTHYAKVVGHAKGTSLTGVLEAAGRAALGTSRYDPFYYPGIGQGVAKQVDAIVAKLEAPGNELTTRQRRNLRSRLNHLVKKHHLREFSELMRDASSKHPKHVRRFWRCVRGVRDRKRTAGRIGFATEEIRSHFALAYTSNRCHDRRWDACSLLSRAEIAPVVVDFGLIKGVIKRLARHKAPGLDGIPHEAVIYAAERNDEAVRTFKRQVNAWLRSTDATAWSGRLVAIPKKSQPKSVSDMRPLVMQSTERKVIESCLLKLLEDHAPQFHDTQAGFRRNMGTVHHLLLLRRRIDLCRKDNLSLVIDAHDIAKAFDSVPRLFVMHCLKEHLEGAEGSPRAGGDPLHSVQKAVQRIFLSPLTLSVDGQEFESLTGVPQGSPLSPYLFNCCMENLVRFLTARGIEVNTDRILLYADDILTFNQNEEQADALEKTIDEWCRTWGGHLNIKKRQRLDIRDSEPDAKPMEYLGMLVTRNGVANKLDFVTAAGHARRLGAFAGHLRTHKLLNIMRSMCFSPLSYGWEISLPWGKLINTMCRQWRMMAKSALRCATATRSFEVQREIGTLNHPIWWFVKRLLTFLYEMGRTPLLKTMFSPADNPWAEGVESICKWLHLSSLSVRGRMDMKGVSCELSVILDNAKAKIATWCSEEIKRAAHHYQLADSEEPRFTRDYTHGPSTFLTLPKGRIGFLFFRNHFEQCDSIAGKCYFCGLDAGDTGKHLIKCDEAIKLLPAALKRQARALKQGERRLVDGLGNEITTSVLSIMDELFTLRLKARKVRDAEAKQKSRADCKTGNGTPSAPIDSEIRRGMKASAIPQLLTFMEPNANARADKRRVKNANAWTLEETAQLERAIVIHGLANKEHLFAAVPTRDRRQVAQKIKGRAMDGARRRTPEALAAEAAIDPEERKARHEEKMRSVYLTLHSEGLMNQKKVKPPAPGDDAVSRLIANATADTRMRIWRAADPRAEAALILAERSGAIEPKGKQALTQLRNAISQGSQQASLSQEPHTRPQPQTLSQPSSALRSSSQPPPRAASKLYSQSQSAMAIEARAAPRAERASVPSQRPALPWASQSCERYTDDPAPRPHSPIQSREPCDLSNESGDDEDEDDPLTSRGPPRKLRPVRILDIETKDGVTTIPSIPSISDSRAIAAFFGSPSARSDKVSGS